MAILSFIYGLKRKATRQPSLLSTILMLFIFFSFSTDTGPKEVKHTLGKYYYEGKTMIAQPSQRHRIPRSAQKDYCSSGSYASGSWQPRATPATNLTEVRDLFGLDAAAKLSCHPLSWPIEKEGEPTLDNEAHIERILQSANFEWKFDDDCRRHDLAVSGLITRLLRSKAGLVLVGDSLTYQHYYIMFNLLYYQGGPFDLISTEGPPRFEGIKLNPHHPATPGLLAAAGVGMSRCDTPLVSVYIEHHLLTRPEMDQAFEGITGYPTFASGQGQEKWVFPSIWYEEYTKLLNTVDLEKDATEGFVEEKSILVLNAGPHWIESEIGGQVLSITYPDLMKGFEKMSDILYDKIKALPTESTTAFWRATAPGHPDCEAYTAPEVTKDYRSKFNPEFMRYNWELFPLMNAHMEKRLNYNSAAGLDPRLHNTPDVMQYLDIWGMSVQRPESHLLPPNDCLHFCFQGVVEEWQKMLWHVVAAQSRNMDYYSTKVAYR